MSVVGAAGTTTDDQTNAAERRAKGEFVRGVSTARNWMSKSHPTYQPESGRYHLYVAYNCPWCHRVLLARSILGLEDAITVDVAFPNRSTEHDKVGGPNMWMFVPNGVQTTNGRWTSFPECTADTVTGKTYVKEIYELAGIHDQKSVPILFDKQTMTVVNNESAEIIRMMATEMMSLSSYGDVADLYPTEKAKEIDELNEWIYKDINNGSYKAGFSSNQEVYETAYKAYFAALDRLEDILSTKTFLTGDKVTEADLRLFPTLFRHDPVYHSRFKLNMAYLWEYRHLWRWMGDMMKLNGMGPLSNTAYLAHCKQGYFGRTGNGTIPVGPPNYPECYKSQNYTPSGKGWEKTTHERTNGKRQR